MGWDRRYLHPPSPLYGIIVVVVVAVMRLSHRFVLAKEKKNRAVLFATLTLLRL